VVGRFSGSGGSLIQRAKRLLERSGVFGAFACDGDAAWGAFFAVRAAWGAAFVGEQFCGVGPGVVCVPAGCGPGDGAVGELGVVPAGMERFEPVMTSIL
jgi:hypothetical protein